MSCLEGSVSCVSEVVFTFVFAEGSDEVPDVAPGVFDVAFLGPAHPVFDLCEGLFDGVEVRGRGIGWQV